MRSPLHLSKSSLAIQPPAPNVERLSDEEVLTRLRHSDPAALELALKRYWSLVVSYIQRLTGSEDTAEDIAQRTFCQLWDRRSHWSTTGSLRALLCRIARNFAVSEHRRELAARRSADSFLELHTSATVTPGIDAADAERLRSTIDREIARLPERRREIIILRCQHDLSYREIADVMNIAEQTVANQLSKGLATLRERLGALLD